MCSRNFSHFLNLHQNPAIRGKFSCCQDVMNYIKDLTNVMKTSNTRLLDSDKLTSLLFVSHFVNSKEDCECSPESFPNSEICVEMFRCLRNSCVQCEDNQNLIRRFPGLYDSTVICLQSLLEKLMLNSGLLNGSETELLALRCGLQFFGNFVVGNYENKIIVWRTLNCKEKSLLSYCLRLEDEKVVDYAAMVLYNILNDEIIAHFMTGSLGSVSVCLLVDCFVRAKSHWSVLILERFCQEPSFWQAYTKLTPRERLVVLDIVAENVSRESAQVAEEFLERLAVWLEENVLDVVKCISQTEDQKPMEIMRCLSVIAASSALTKYSVLQRNLRLLEASINVLKAVHILGKTSSNVFSPISSIRVRTNSDEAPENCPAYCFKKDLVRLIGNLCSSNRRGQDMVRELDGIPLLLDCCNMDAKNPFIVQWCTFALRNVMDSNPENQSVLASLTVTGELVNSPLLTELGFSVVQDNTGRITLQRT